MLDPAVRRCYVCGSEDVDNFTRVNGFDLFKCGLCGLIWVDGELSQSEIQAFYDENYYVSGSKIGYRNYFGDEDVHRRSARNLIKTVSRVSSLSGARVLDIGCAGGFLLDECRKMKQCEVYGVEVSGYTYKHAKKLGINVINAEFDPSLFEPEFFDVVFLVNTIEHLIDPGDILTGINIVLKKGGMLVVTTIDTGGLLPFYSMKPPEHLFYFNHDNLTLLLNKKGFKSVSRKTYFENYYIDDLFHRLKEFSSSLSFFEHISSFFTKHFPRAHVRIPTNQMIVIARKLSPGAVS